MSKEIIHPSAYLRTVPDIGGGDIIPIKSRAKIREESARDVISAGADEVFGNLFEVLGTTSVQEVHPLSPTEINDFASELLAVRSAQDIITGRADALKKYATDVINLNLEQEGKDSNSESGFLYSTEHKIKLSKEVSGNKLAVDVELLEKVLDSEQFHSIVNFVETTTIINYPDGRVTTEVKAEKILNEEALEQEIKKGNIGMEQIVQAAIPGKARTAFYVRQVK